MNPGLKLSILAVAGLASSAFATDPIRYLHDARRCTAAFGGNGSGSTFQDRPTAYDQYQGGVTMTPGNPLESWVGQSDQVSWMDADGMALSATAHASVSGTPSSAIYAQGQANFDIWFAVDAPINYVLSGSVTEQGHDSSEGNVLLTNEGGTVIENIVSQPDQPGTFSRQGTLQPGTYHFLVTILGRAAIPDGLTSTGECAGNVRFAVSSQDEHANSVTQFSGTQGSGGWYYGSWDRQADPNGIYSSEEVTLMPDGCWDGTEWAANAPARTCLYSNSVNPNGANNGHEHWVVRRWISDFEGVAQLTGTIRKVETGAGDGTINYIIVDGNYLLRQDLRFDDGTGTAYSVNARVHVGSVLDFVTAPGATDTGDRTRFTAHIVEIPEPIMDTGLGFSGIQGLNGWWYGWYRPATDHSAPGYQPPDFRALPGYAWTGVRWYRVEAPAPRTLISYSHMAPNDNNQGIGGPYWVIRRWMSDYAGVARLSGTLQKVTGSCGDGTRGVIYQNGHVIWTGVIGANDTMGFAFDFPLFVQQGDTFDFCVQDLQDDGCDYTRFTASLSRNP